MLKKHGARQQKKIAKQKAKRQAKRSALAQRTSGDPTVRLHRAEKWPIIQAMVSSELWDQGLGHLVLAREEPDGGTVLATFLVDVYCLGVKDAFWRAGTREDLREILQQLERTQPLSPIDPACLVKIVQGAVEYARSLGFTPHPDFRHASLLLAGIDPSECREEFEYGKNGKPMYIQGPHETPAQIRAILERTKEAGGDFVLVSPPMSSEGFPAIEDDSDDEEIGEDEGPAGPRWNWRGRRS